MLAGALMLASAVGTPGFVPLDTVIETFEAVCVSPSTIAAQRQAANALPDVTSERISDYDNEKRRAQVPGVNYRTQGMQIGVFGRKSASTCSVATILPPDMTADGFMTVVGARFEKKPRKTISTDEFARGGWIDHGRQFDLEWRRKDGRIIALLAVRKRDGYS